MNSVKYYEISFSTNEAIVGYKPQINTIRGAKEKDVQFYDSLRTMEEHPKKIPKLDKLILDDDAILTDLISVSLISPGYSLLINASYWVNLLTINRMYGF